MALRSAEGDRRDVDVKVCLSKKVFVQLLDTCLSCGTVCQLEKSGILLLRL